MEVDIGEPFYNVVECPIGASGPDCVGYQGL